MIIYKQILLLPFVFLALFKNQCHLKTNVNTFFKYTESRHFSMVNEFKPKRMGISINLYRLPKAEKLDDIKDLESQIAKTADTRVDLYKNSGDLAVVFLNTTDPYRSTNTIPYKMLYGKKVDKSIDNVGEIGGFLPSSEIPGIVSWIKANKIDTFDGFSKIYDNLSPEVKKELEDMDTYDKVSLFVDYVRPLVVLYFTALENENSVIFAGR
ncbi:MAG: hypothetical protein EOP45_03815 [Sphingobacteriaceae bacterium]|nr:MAG: hypothetical protein EOP45_03815 [Sphingobacteriaceae bacterium]